MFGWSFRSFPDPEPVTSEAFLHHQRVVQPLERTLRNTLPMAGSVRYPFLDVPLDFRQDGTRGTTFWYPAELFMSPDLKRTTVELISSRLGLDDPVATWTTSGLQPHVVLKPKTYPPTQVLWADILDALETAEPTAPVVGLTTGRQVVDADLEADSPHIAISAGSGGGKSVLVRALLAQGLHHGAGAVILDFKRSSHTWALGLPGVLYCKDIEDIHDALINLGREAERRNKASDDPDADIGNRLFLVAEEMNATMFKLQAYWEEIRDKSDPKVSPAVAALRDVLFMGRSTRINVIAVAQMLSARAIGGPEARENFATRALTRYTMNAWRMLAPEVWPAPKRSKLIGRWQLVKGGEAYATQVVYSTDEEARSWALSGRPHGVLELAQTTSDLGRDAGSVLTRTGLPLSVAIEELPGDEITLDALRKASQRDDRFPLAVGRYGPSNLYDVDQLAAWKRRRDAGGAL